MAAILIQAVFLPIIIAPLVYLLGKNVGKRVGWVAFAVMLYSTLLLLLSATMGEPYVETYPWRPVGDFGLKADGLSLPFAAIITILTATMAIYSMPYMQHRIHQETQDKSVLNRRFGLYYSLYLLYAAGMLGTVLATNLIQFYIFFELMLIPSYFLIAEFGYGAKSRISFMYFIWTHIGALLLLVGLLSIGLLGGSFNIAEISDAGIAFNVRLWIAAAITIGLFVKLAAFGVHIWLPHAHAEAPTPISALLSPAMIGIGGYALIRLLLFVLPSVYLTTTFVISIWGLITMIYGALMALAQDDIKRLLAYSSVSQMGYIIFGLSSAFYVGVSGSVFQYVSHGTAKAILFMVAGTIILQTGGLRSISKMGGLAKKLPITAFAAMIGFLTLFGVPPLNGFQSEWMLFYGSFAGALQLGSPAKMLITAIALGTTAITAGYALWTMKRVFFGSLPENLVDVKEAGPTVLAPMIFLVVVTLILGIHPSLINDHLVPTLAGVMTGGG